MALENGKASEESNKKKAINTNIGNTKGKKMIPIK